MPPLMETPIYQQLPVDLPGESLEGWIASQLRVDRAVDARACACSKGRSRFHRANNRSNRRVVAGWFEQNRAHVVHCFESLDGRQIW